MLTVAQYASQSHPIPLPASPVNGATRHTNHNPPHLFSAVDDHPDPLDVVLTFLSLSSSSSICCYAFVDSALYYSDRTCALFMILDNQRVLGNSGECVGVY